MRKDFLPPNFTTKTRPLSRLVACHTKKKDQMRKHFLVPVNAGRIRGSKGKNKIKEE